MRNPRADAFGRCCTLVPFLLGAQPASAERPAPDHPSSPAEVEAPSVPSSPAGEELDRQEPSWLVWSAPRGCPDADQLHRGIEALLKHPVEARTGFSASATVEEQSAGFALRLSIASGADTGSREVVFPTCIEAADFVSLSIALAIDSDALAPTPAHRLGSRHSAPAPQERQPPAHANATGADTTASAPPDTAGPPPTGASNAVPSPWFVGAAVSLTTGHLPEVAVGPTVVVGRTLGKWLLAADATFLPGGVSELSEAPNPVRFRWFGATAGGCRMVAAGRMTAGLCARAQMGAVTAREQAQGEERSPYGGAGFFLGLLAGTDGTVKIAGAVRGYWSANCSIPLVTSRFELLNGTFVYRPNVGFQGSLGALYFF